MADRAGESVAKCLGHMERMSDERLTKMMYVSAIREERKRKRSN